MLGKTKTISAYRNADKKALLFGLTLVESECKGGGTFRRLTTYLSLFRQDAWNVRAVMTFEVLSFVITIQAIISVSHSPIDFIQ